MQSNKVLHCQSIASLVTVYYEVQLVVVISNTDNSNYCLSQTNIRIILVLVLLYILYISSLVISNYVYRKLKIMIPWSLR